MAKVIYKSHHRCNTHGNGVRARGEDQYKSFNRIIYRKAVKYLAKDAGSTALFQRLRKQHNSTKAEGARGFQDPPQQGKGEGRRVMEEKEAAEAEREEILTKEA